MRETMNIVVASTIGMLFGVIIGVNLKRKTEKSIIEESISEMKKEIIKNMEEDN